MPHRNIEKTRKTRMKFEKARQTITNPKRMRPQIPYTRSQ
ncbi:hypothetical protein TcasGA2_TC006366 [Tribolium castaneum]|uniref:Uncharacterized protein n=1 Tax=Tribolium castaneum TaxID=7070 RepID=D6WWD4_TRICA|nr:hypothetical protein TcasGA2_TC006366 [Tribolium castaneum]